MKPVCPREYSEINKIDLAEEIVRSWDMDTLLQFALEKVCDDMNDDDAFYNEWDLFYEGVDIDEEEEKSYRVQILNPTVKDNVRYFDSLEKMNEFASGLEFPHRRQVQNGNDWDNVA